MTLSDADPNPFSTRDGLPIRDLLPKWWIPEDQNQGDIQIFMTPKDDGGLKILF